MAKLVSKTYGEALFELAQEEDKVLPLLEEVCALQTILLENKELALLMNNPKVSKEERVEILKSIFGEKVSRELMGFLELLVQKGRYGEIDAILAYFIQRVKDAEGIGKAYITTAIPLKEAQKAAVEAKLLSTTSYRRIETEYAVDESLIGGMTIRIKDRVVDSSIKTKLERMERELLTIQLGSQSE